MTVREERSCQRLGSGVGTVGLEGSCVITIILLQAPPLALANQDHANLPAFS